MACFLYGLILSELINKSASLWLRRGMDFVAMAIRRGVVCALKKPQKKADFFIKRVRGQEFLRKVSPLKSFLQLSCKMTLGNDDGSALPVMV
jgi:hypothetical protein